MNENEDYLESLLKAAASNDNPDSAISRVSKITRERAEEMEKNESPEVSEIPAEETDLADLLASGNEDEIPESVEGINLDEIIDANHANSEVEELAIEEPALAEEPVIEETLITEDVPVIDTMTESENTEQPSIEEVGIDALLSDDPGAVENTFPSDESLDAAMLVQEAERKATEGEASIEDIDTLLSSDFSGEINIDENLLNVSEENASENILADLDSLTSEDSDAVEEPVSDEGTEDFNLADIESLIDSENSVANESDTMNDLSQDDIEKMLEAAKTGGEGEPAGEMEIDLNDMAAFENEFGIFEKNGDSGEPESAEGDNAELDEISNLLKSIDSNEVSEETDDDMLNMLNEAVAKSVEEDEIAEAKKAQAKAQKETEEETGKKKKGKKKKKEKEPVGEVDEALKEKGKLAKFFDFLTAEEESEEESLINAVDAEPEGNENVPDGENKDILNEVDAEEEGKGKGKKIKKKDKKKKGKKGKGGEEGDESDDSSESEDGEEGDDGKKKKAKKPKKERKPLELDIDTGKPLNKKNVILIFIMALSVLVAIILIVKLVPPSLSKKAAREAFYEGDYETTYTTFYGESKLKEADQILYDRSLIILKVRHKYDAYMAYRKINMGVEALDQLLQAVASYPVWKQSADICGATKQFDEEYDKILKALKDEYGLSESDAQGICALVTDLEYSLMVESVAKGIPYIDPNAPMPGETPQNETQYEEPVNEEQDVLREEGM